MATIFARQYARASWNPNELSGPCRDLTLREWEASVVLCSQAPALRSALFDWLSAPPEGRRWPLSDSFSRSRAPFVAGAVRQPVDTLLDLFYDELQAILQTLDAPFAALHGIARDVLLVARGARLRQVTAALGEARALQEIEALTRPARQEQTLPAAYLRERWGGRWANFFLCSAQAR